MGVEGVGSCSGALEVMVKSEAKESIVVCECERAMKLSEAQRLTRVLLLYIVSLS
jgi:hypothetical protein